MINSNPARDLNPRVFKSLSVRHEIRKIAYLKAFY
uniref:Uncharacterized protein n=1 Tax=Inoviridae sp. ctTUL13 TaxID=2825782 RepID=A0A8S5UQ17_9VIRU|nr:MAG TPA: hypothetical protein [Inoviridae sp. ctTUL13]